MIGTDIERAAELLRSGKVIGIPTETVYGLAANALNEEAVLDIYQIKNRPSFDPLISHFPNKDSIYGYVKEFPVYAQKLSDTLWPGPLTLLLESNGKLPLMISSGSPKIAVRVPGHKMSLELLGLLEFPLAAPSANPFGYISPTRAEHVEAQLGEKIPYILDGGECSIGLESTIIDASSERPKILRLGGYTLSEIAEAGEIEPELLLNQNSNPQAPGQLDKHYSPKSKFILTENIKASLEEHAGKKISILTFGAMEEIEGVFQLNLSKSGSTREAAKNLFHYLRMLDESESELIISVKLPEEEWGLAINDRLRRAAAK